MQVHTDTPFHLVLEIYAHVLWVPVLTIAIAAGVLFAVLKCGSTRLGIQGQLAAVSIVLVLFLPILWLGFAYGALTLLEHPGYRHHIECDPCF
ncbi:conserved hypothetical protein [Hoeflea sp. EC-HK425]|nr:conserved hypothetical protein [Hoeflea sp. EC-HK425]